MNGPDHYELCHKWGCSEIERAPRCRGAPPFRTAVLARLRRKPVVDARSIQGLHGNAHRFYWLRKIRNIPIGILPFLVREVPYCSRFTHQASSVAGGLACFKVRQRCPAVTPPTIPLLPTTWVSQWGPAKRGSEKFPGRRNRPGVLPASAFSTMPSAALSCSLLEKVS